MALLQRIQAAQNQGARRMFTDVDALRAFVAQDRPDRGVRINIRMRLYAATNEDNGCRLALLTNLEDEDEFRAVCTGLHNLADEAGVPFLFLVLAWGATVQDYNFVEGDHVSLSNVYTLQDWKGRRLGGTVRRTDVSRIQNPVVVVTPAAHATATDRSTAARVDTQASQRLDGDGVVVADDPMRGADAADGDGDVSTVDGAERVDESDTSGDDLVLEERAV